MITTHSLPTRAWASTPPKKEAIEGLDNTEETVVELSEAKEDEDVQVPD